MEKEEKSDSLENQNKDLSDSEHLKLQGAALEEAFQEKLLTPDFFYWTHDYILKNIILADQKASYLIPLNVAVTGGLYAVSRDYPTSESMFIVWLFFLCYCFLLMGLVFGALVIYPRGEKLTAKTSGGELVAPQKIGKLRIWEYQRSVGVEGSQSSIQTDGNSVVELDHKIIAEQYSSLIYSKSRINNLKYSYLRVMLLSSMIGWSIGLLLMLLPWLSGIFPWVPSFSEAEAPVV